MLKKLKRKFVLTTTGIVFVLLTVILGICALLSHTASMPAIWKHCGESSNLRQRPEHFKICREMWSFRILLCMWAITASTLPAVTQALI